MPESELFPLRAGLHHLGRHAQREDEIRERALGDPQAVGLELYAQNRFEEAEPVLRWAVERGNDSFDVLMALGHSLFQTSRWGEAEPFFERALKLQPQSAKAQFWYGETLLKVGRFIEAQTIFEAIAGTEPFLAQARRWVWQTIARLKGEAPAASLLPPTVNPKGDDPHAKLAFARVRAEIIENARGKISAARKLNPSWNRAERGRKVTVRNVPIIRPGMKIFTMGSCFAVEIRHELARQGFEVFPKYFEIPFDSRRQILDSLPDRDNINHYDTFTIRQEVEFAFTGRRFRADELWEVKGAPINKVMRRETVYQDPHRKNVFAVDREATLEASHQISATILDGLESADVYIFTLGLIETWRNPATGLHACCYPGVGGGGGGEEQSVLHVGTYEENYANMKRVCELIFERFPEKKIIVTVSPVSLQRTFRDMDVVVANTESKSLLRAVAGQLVRELPSVHYLPSYELFLYHDLYHDDGRHATRNGVETVFELFRQSFMAPAGGAEKTSEAPKTEPAAVSA